MERLVPNPNHEQFDADTEIGVSADAATLVGPGERDPKTLDASPWDDFESTEQATTEQDTSDLIDIDLIKNDPVLLELLPPKPNGEAWTEAEFAATMPQIEMIGDPETGQKRETAICDGRPESERDKPIETAVIFELSFSTEIKEIAARIQAWALSIKMPVIITTPPGRGESDQLTREQIADMMNGDLDEFAKAEIRTILNHPELQNLLNVFLMGFSEGGRKAAAAAANLANHGGIALERRLAKREDGEEFWVEDEVQKPSKPLNLLGVSIISGPGAKQDNRNIAKLTLDTVSSSKPKYDTNGEAYLREAWRSVRAREYIDGHEVFGRLPEIAKVALEGVAWASRRLREKALDITDPLYAVTLAKGDMEEDLIRARQAFPKAKISLTTSVDDDVGTPGALRHAHDTLAAKFGTDGLYWSLQTDTIPTKSNDGTTNHSRMQDAQIFQEVASQQFHTLDQPGIIR